MHLKKLSIRNFRRLNDIVIDLASDISIFVGANNSGKTSVGHALHGVKGPQFERVLVVIDDEEGAHRQYSYGKYFGYLPLSDTDQINIAEGKDSVLDRTRRLFYVCCSRAVKDLVVVVFVPDVAAARAAVLAEGLFPEAAFRGVEDLP